MRYAVTGASGFVGRLLIESPSLKRFGVNALSRTHPSGEDDQGVYWFRGDLLDAEPEALAPFLDGTRVLLHCAGELRDESVMAGSHVEGTRRLIEAARGRIDHWVQLSSCGVYGAVRSGTVTEDFPLRPTGEYERTKLISEELVLKGAEEGGFTATVLRPSIVFGEGMPNESIRSWIRAIRRGHFFYIGKKGSIANYVHVQNVVDALVSCAENPIAVGRIYNLSDSVRIESFVDGIRDGLNRNRPIPRIPESMARFVAAAGSRIPGFPLSPSRVDALSQRAVYSAVRIQRELGYSFRVPTIEGILRLAKATSQPHTSRDSFP